MKIIGIGLAAFCMFVLQLLLYEKLWDKNLKATVFFKQNEISEGEEGEIIEVIENRKRLPLPMLKVKFQTSKYLRFSDTHDLGSKTTDQYYRNDVFQVGAQEKITRKLRFTGKKRGYYHIQSIDLVGFDMFLFHENVKNITTESYLYVYPKAFISEEFRLSLQKQNGEIQVKRHLLEDPFMYRGIREYQPYDDMRSVNWKATARTGALKVNQKGYSAVQMIRIFVNLEDEGIWKKDRELEAAMQIVMGIASFFLSQGIPTACYTSGRDICTGEPVEIHGGAGAGQLDAFGKALARIDTEKTKGDFRELLEEKILEEADSFFTFFVSPNGDEDFTLLLKQCMLQGMDFCWYYPVAYTEESEVPEELQGYVHILKC